MNATRPSETERKVLAEDEYLAEVHRLKDQIAEMRKSVGSEDHEWLRTLYAAFSDRMRSDNERIWSTASIFVPLSLSAFAALATLERPAPWKTALLGFASTGLLVVWLFIAENHRAFQQKSQAWLVAISTTIGINDVGPEKIQDGPLNRLLTFRRAIQKMRWAVVIIVGAAWIYLYVLHVDGRIWGGAG